MTVSPGVSPHDYAVREKRLVSFFGPQARSTKVSAPAFGFGSGTRDDTEKVRGRAPRAVGPPPIARFPPSRVAAPHSFPDRPHPGVAPAVARPPPLSRRVLGRADRHRPRVPSASHRLGIVAASRRLLRNGTASIPIDPVVRSTSHSRPTLPSRLPSLPRRPLSPQLYLSAEHARAIPGTCSPGPVYDPPSSVGAQPASIHPSAPAPSFDKTIRRLEKSNEWATQHVRHRDLLEGAEDFPGPCSYALPDAVGDQPLSQKASRPKISVAKSTREQAGAVYQGVASEVPGRDAPPVGTYFHRDASSAGPDASSSMGKQTDASKPTSPSAGFPRERRFAEKSQGRGFVKPGPGAHFQDGASPTAASPGDSPTGGVSGGSPSPTTRAAPGSSSPLGRRSRGRGGGKTSKSDGSFVASGGPSSVGKQTLSRSRSEPRSPGLGAATREARERVYVSRGHEKDLFGRIGPGPASPDFRASEWGLGSSLGRQRHSLTTDQPSPTFPRSSRWGPADRGASEPGPGAYDA